MNILVCVHVYTMYKYNVMANLLLPILVNNKIICCLQEMSFSGYSDYLASVGGGFLNILIDLGDEKQCGSTLTLVPIGFLFFLFSCYGFMLDLISFQTAVVYSIVMLFSLTIILRMEKKINVP